MYTKGVYPVAKVPKSYIPSGKKLPKRYVPSGKKLPFCYVHRGKFCMKGEKMNTKFIFVTGGVVSGLGKGITAASLRKTIEK